MSSEVNIILGSEYIEVIATRMVLIKSHTPVTLNAAVHFMVNERAEVLIFIRAFFIGKSPVIMTRHYSHILQVTGTAFITHRTIMWVVCHQPFYHIRTEFSCLGICY
jgi:hypothetical protein